ncbi:MAG: serine hydroxymethyltransferase [Nitrospinae bacterium]|nr:serine hydroxymethyltransferase [Nitrospinota bacterium]
MTHLERTDPEIAALIRQEQERQFESIRLIPSENYTSHAVLEATGSILTNKYSEGYPAKRYYEGQEFIDPIESLARERAKQLFGAEHANVQPYSGSPANLATYYALVEPGTKIMGMSLPHGGHLTHGWRVNFSARFYQAVQYTVDPVTRRIDYDQVRELAKKEQPKLIFSGATAYPREFDFKTFAEIAQEVGARFVADIAHIAGLIVAGVHQSPIPYADVVTTTTHKTLRGPRGAMILCKAEHAEAIDRAVFPALQGGPHNHTTAAIAVALGPHNHTTAAIAVALREASTPEFKEYGRQIVRNAKALAEELLVYGFDLVTGGTDNHLLLIDMTSKGITGKQASRALAHAGIETNANTVPYDSRRPFDPSGVRIGTPAVTSRGMQEPEMKRVAAWINQVVSDVKNDALHAQIRGEVREFCRAFPCPGIRI